MAKSLRSKWKRKCRAVKRERYGKKELERLKKTLGIDEKTQSSDVSMQEVTEIANNVTQKTKETSKTVDKNSMETNERIFDPKTLRDQHGAHPIWLHPRKIVKKYKGKKKKSNSKTNKKKN